MLKDVMSKMLILETVPFTFSRNYNEKSIKTQHVRFRTKKSVLKISAICALIVIILIAIIILASTVRQEQDSCFVQLSNVLLCGPEATQEISHMCPQNKELGIGIKMSLATL